jgi:Kdo2-lipid IVA lauroyltransferase/acyltransferase
MNNSIFDSKLLHPRYWLSWLGVALIQTLGRLPLPLLWALGGSCGRLAYVIAGRRRQVARRNLKCCFPNLNAAQREWLLWTHFGWLGVAALSQGVNWGISRQRVNRLIKITNRSVIDGYLAVGRPIILLAPHFLALDLGGAGLMAQVHPGIHMYQRLRNPVFNWRVQRARCQFGSIPVERQAELRGLIRVIKTGAPFIYLPDQDAGRRGIFVPFCQQPAATVPMLGRFAALTNAVVIPTITRFLPWGRGVELIFAAPLEQFPSGDPIADTTRMNQIIESWLPQLAAQYFWVHRRFKTRPTGMAALYPPKNSFLASFFQKRDKNTSHLASGAEDIFKSATLKKVD